MASILTPEIGRQSLPDHRQLPQKDGTFVTNFQEHPQAMLLTDCLLPILRQRHPDGQYCLGHDCGIYWRVTDPPLLGCKAPDWFYVPGVPPLLEGEIRRSFVLWQEGVAPLIAIEFVSGDGAEERNRTPVQGKFWVYEQGIRIPFYAIFEVNQERVELYRLEGTHYQQIQANERGHLPLPDLGLGLGIWHGCYHNQELPWLRWWDLQGKLLPTSEERAERLAEKLRSLGVDPDTV